MTGQANQPLKLAADANGPAALRYILAHDERVKFLDGLRLRVLKETWAQTTLMDVMAAADDRDSLVSYITEEEFPDLTSAKEIHYDWVMAAQPALGQE